MIKSIKKMLFLFGMLAGMAFALPGIASAETYTYDNAGRLTAVTYDDSSTISYTYDSRGNRLQLTSTTVGPDINNPPSIPVLVSPAVDAIDLDPTSIVFEWQASDDPDNDPLSYQFFICEDPAFNGCSGVNVASAAVSISIALLGGGGGGYLLLGLMGNQGRRRRHWWLSPKLAVLAAIVLMASCGGGGGDSPPTGTNINHTVTGLKSATTYYWKVSANDGNGGITESEVRSFITQ